MELVSNSVDGDFDRFVQFLSSSLDAEQQQEMLDLDLFEFNDCAREQPDVAKTEVRKTRKPRVKTCETHTTVQQRFKSSRSAKFSSIAEEANFRLFSTCTKKTSLIDQLVRTCYYECGDTWVSWKQLKAIARRVGYKPSSQLFSSVWVLTHCLYGSTQRNCTWLPALTFPYWQLDTSRYDVAVKAGVKLPAKEELYMLRLSEHFFSSPSLVVAV